MAVDFVALSERFNLDYDITCESVANSESVFTLGWDTNFPGGSGAIWVNKWKGMYFVISSDYEPDGPYEDLDTVLSLERFEGPTSNPEITCYDLPFERLEEIARNKDEYRQEQFTINDERYEWNGDSLQKVEG